MTSGEPPAGPSAAKIGGYVLVGIGALAAVFGVGTMMTGETHNTAQPTGVTTNPPASSSTPHPTSEADSPKPPTPSSEKNRAPAPETSAPREPSRSQSRSQAPPRPPAEGTPERPRPQEPEQSSDSRVALRVYNNSKIRDLAHRAAADFRAVGYKVTEIDNYSGLIPETTVYYRPGTPEKARAEAVAERFGASAKPRFDGIEQASPGIIVIVTKDYDGPEPGK
ncbi:type IV secretory pathway VirB10-like protein [Saccharopolyspora lacisalsi]|uniref:Type IV secretory pathway VirB10-like protein n=1 Tax=Halosaccharopolyspora lacisalsi TaxID=1000566 RepID=A0A839E0Q6_9PSEU|nr:LytR C-terminal domain-containing protein [Halosaccharopolyspora lacisalsi]MBA8826680.1 type IV secretory pathway VirB10-like protein [Halosaccharopolyspora lacisalsi]